MVGKNRTPFVGVRGNTTNDVTPFMARLEHPRKAEIETVSAIMLGADPRIHESIKWNPPRFAITEHFATVKLRPIEQLSHGAV